MWIESTSGEPLHPLKEKTWSEDLIKCYITGIYSLWQEDSRKQRRTAGAAESSAHCWVLQGVPGFKAALQSQFLKVQIQDNNVFLLL